MNISQIKEIAKSVLNHNFSDVSVIDYPNVYAVKIKGKRIAGGNSIPQKLRAMNLLKLNEEKETFEISQVPQFKQLGTMIDNVTRAVLCVLNRHRNILKDLLCSEQTNLCYIPRIRCSFVLRCHRPLTMTLESILNSRLYCSVIYSVYSMAYSVRVSNLTPNAAVLSFISFKSAVIFKKVLSLFFMQLFFHTQLYFAAFAAIFVPSIYTCSVSAFSF